MRDIFIKETSKTQMNHLFDLLLLFYDLKLLMDLLISDLYVCLHDVVFQAKFGYCCKLFEIVEYICYKFFKVYVLFSFEQLEYTKPQAGMFSTTFEIGGVLGSAAIGVILDR